MQQERIRAVFEAKGYTPSAYISKSEYFQVLDSLVRSGEGFNQQVAEELWQQATGSASSRECKVDLICAAINEAQTILRNRIRETVEEIRILESEKRRYQTTQARDYVPRIQEIDSRLQELEEDKLSFQQDYRLVTEPFGTYISDSPKRASAEAAVPYLATTDYDYDEAGVNVKKLGYTSSDELKVLLYLTAVFGFIEIVMIYGKSDFLNLIVLTCLLSIYLLDFFDRPYIRLTLALVLTSIMLDLVWLIMYAGPKWNPAAVSNTSIYMVGYMRFIVFFTVALLPVKLVALFVLFRHKDISPDEKYLVEMGPVKIRLSSGKSNPISKGLVDNMLALAL